MRFGKLRFFAMFAGAALFLVGLFTFAFRTGSQVPDWHALLDIVLGLWGVLISLNNKK